MWLPYSLPCGSHIHSHVAPIFTPILAPIFTPILAPILAPYFRALNSFIVGVTLPRNMLLYVDIDLYFDLYSLRITNFAFPMWLLPANLQLVDCVLGVYWERLDCVLTACWQRVGSVLTASWQRVGRLYTPKVAPIWCNVSYADIYRYSFIVIHSHIGSILAVILAPKVAPMWCNMQYAMYVTTHHDIKNM
jgi:hypothetical protein